MVLAEIEIESGPTLVGFKIILALHREYLVFTVLVSHVSHASHASHAIQVERMKEP